MEKQEQIEPYAISNASSLRGDRLNVDFAD